MKIGARLLISYFVIGATIMVGMIFLSSSIIRGLSDKNIQAEEGAVRILANADFESTESMLTAQGKEMVAMQGSLVAAQLSSMLKNRDLTNYEDLRKDLDLRRIAAQDIRTAWGVAGYTDVMDNKGVAVWHQVPQRRRPELCPMEGRVPCDVETGRESFCGAQCQRRLYVCG